MRLNKTRLEQIINMGLLAIAVTIPFWMLLNNISIIVTFILSIVYFFNTKDVCRKWTRVFSVFFFLYILMVIALIYTEDIGTGLKRLEQRLLFVLMPLIGYFVSNLMTNDRIYRIMKYFVTATVLTTLVFMINACVRTYHFASPNPFNETNGNFFSYMEFTSIIEDTHPIYFGTYVLFSIFILTYDYIESRGVFRFNNSFRLMIIVYLTVITFFLNSFLLTIIAGLMFIYLIFQILIKLKFNPLLKLGLVSLFIGIIAISSYFVQDKFNGIQIQNDLTNTDFSGSKFTALRARMAKAYCSFDLIQDNFWLGVGPGDERTELVKYYVINGFDHGKNKNFNSHNQYLTEFIYTGILGAITLLALFVMIIRKGLNDRNYYLATLGIIFLLFNLTESALVRNKGIVFFVFFTCILIYLRPLKQEENLKQP